MKLKWVKVDNNEWEAQGGKGRYAVCRNHECTRGEGTNYWWDPRLNGNYIGPDALRTTYFPLGEAKQYCQSWEDRSP